MINIRKATRIVLPLVGGMIIGRLTAKAQNDYRELLKSLSQLDIYPKIGRAHV